MSSTAERGKQAKEARMSLRVTDLKQWVYCPRILYYALVLPDIRPVTYKMEAGVEAGQAEEGREARRSLKAYGLSEGRREFEVRVESEKLGLHGVVDLAIYVGEPGKGEVIPVDYKLSEYEGEHFKLQLMAYGALLEERSGYAARRGFLYYIPKRQAEEVKFTGRLREKLSETAAEMQAAIESERMPAATRQRGRCTACEFRRFCNDID